MDQEKIIFPDLPIIDSHMHLWNRINCNYFAEDYISDIMDGHKVEASIFVECGTHYSDDALACYRSLGETRFALEEACRLSEYPININKGIVVSVDILLGSKIGLLLDAHITTGKGRVVGVRHQMAYDPDPKLIYSNISKKASEALENPHLIKAINEISKRGLVFEVWCFHTQLDLVKRFALRFPQLAIIINHVGGPLGIGKYAHDPHSVYMEWSSLIESLAEVKNIYIKLSGLGITRMGHFLNPDNQIVSSDQLASAWEKYVIHCVNAFGTERCVFASNFPVDRRVTSYRNLLNSYKKMLSHYSYDELLAIFSGNAIRVYGLK